MQKSVQGSTRHSEFGAPADAPACHVWVLVASRRRVLSPPPKRGFYFRVCWRFCEITGKGMGFRRTKAVRPAGWALWREPGVGGRAPRSCSSGGRQALPWAPGPAALVMPDAPW